MTSREFLKQINLINSIREKNEKILTNARIQARILSKNYLVLRVGRAGVTVEERGLKVSNRVPHHDDYLLVNLIDDDEM